MHPGIDQFAIALVCGILAAITTGLWAASPMRSDQGSA